MGQQKGMWDAFYAKTIAKQPGVPKYYEERFAKLYDQWATSGNISYENFTC